MLVSSNYVQTSQNSTELPPPPIRRRRGDREGDWRCEKCGVQNFTRRNRCYGCKAPRAEMLVVKPKIRRVADIQEAKERVPELVEDPARPRVVLTEQTLPDSKLAADGQQEQRSSAAAALDYQQWLAKSQDETASIRRPVDVHIPEGNANQENEDGEAAASVLPRLIRSDDGEEGEGTEDPYADDDPTPTWEGDWFCPSCEVKNFERRLQCFQCGYTRTGKDRAVGLLATDRRGDAGQRIERSGDWRCVHCGTHNFRHRTKCMNCRGEPTLEQEVDRTLRPVIYWKCQRCEETNRSTTLRCNWCQAPKPEPEPEQPDDDECTIRF